MDQLRRVKRPGFVPDQVVVWGAWGDVLAALGNVLALGLQDRPITYWGFDPAIAEFIRYQGWGGEVFHVKPESRKVYLDAISQNIWNWTLCDWRRYMQVPSLTWAALADKEPHTLDVERWKPELAQEFTDYGRKMVEKYRRGSGRVILVQPRSDHSCPWAYHWQHWYTAIKELCATTRNTYLLVGQGWGWYEPHPRLVNLVDQIPSMAHVFGLAEACDSIITTSNGLSMWCRARNVRAIVCPNAAFDDDDNYFKRWVQGGSIDLIHWRAPMRTLMRLIEDDDKHYSENSRGVLPALQ